MIASTQTRYAPFGELPRLDQPTANEWLSPREAGLWQTMRSPERRATFLAGRIAAKQLVRRVSKILGDYNAPPTHIDIHSADADRGRWPRVWIAKNAQDWSLSIAHTHRGVLVALAVEPGMTVGVDLVCDRTVRRQRLAWSFTPIERDWMNARDVSNDPERLWALKEALYKACQHGKGFAPGRIEAIPGRTPRYECSAPVRRVRYLQSWRVDGHFAALAIAECVGDDETHQHQVPPTAILRARLR
jgi:phosphopantetheinyl transferase